MPSPLSASWLLVEDPIATPEAVGTGQITDHVVAALDRLPEQHRHKTNLPTLLGILVAPSQDVENALWQLHTERTVDAATGATLTAIGKVVGQPRNGVTDDDTYRRYVRARISANKASGIVEEILTVINLVIYDDDATLALEQNYPASFLVRVNDVAVTAGVADIAAEFLGQIAAAGVQYTLISSTVAPVSTFTFDIGPGFDTGYFADARR